MDQRRAIATFVRADELGSFNKAAQDQGTSAQAVSKSVRAPGFTDTVADRIDIGFRAGTQPANQVVARRLFPIQQIVCAAPAYLAAHGTPTRRSDLAGHRCTGYRQPGTGRPSPWEFEIRGETAFQSVPVALCSSDPEAGHVTFQGAKDWLANAATTMEFLQPGDVAEVVAFIAAQPKHVNLQQVVVMPTRVV